MWKFLHKVWVSENGYFSWNEVLVGAITGSWHLETLVSRCGELLCIPKPWCLLSILNHVIWSQLFPLLSAIFVLYDSNFSGQQDYISKWTIQSHFSMLPHVTALQKSRITICREQHLRFKWWDLLAGQGFDFDGDGWKSLGYFYYYKHSDVIL